MKKSFSISLLMVLAMVMGLSCLVGCEEDKGADGKDLTAADPPTCTELTSLEIPDVTILSATEVEATDTVPAHCLCKGVIGAEIKFELLLPEPEDWNEKFLMGGGGGFVGSVQNQSIAMAINGSSIKRGYATVGTDTGHTGNGFDAGWAHNNPEAQLNFGYRAVHLTAETAKSIIRTYYDRDIKYSYFQGCSRGGGQAMMEAQRYPGDFDGIICGAPAFDWTGTVMAMIWNQQTMYPDPADISSPVVALDKLELLETLLLDNCDGTDGLTDGLIDDPRNCTFDFSTNLPMCPGDVDGPDCFTTTQLAAIKRVYDGPSNSTGQIFPGYPYGGENDTGRWPNGWDNCIVGSENRLGVGLPNHHYAFGEGVMKYFVYNDPSYDFRNFNFETDVPDTVFTSKILNATDTDLSAFKAYGGKMIMYHGWSDSLLSASATIQYYEDVIDTMGGAENVEDFIRLFLAPGMGHCLGGSGPNMADWLTALEQWVENGIAPDSIIASHIDETTGQVDRNRPLCPYPQVAVYSGTGSIDDAANFTCQNPN